MRRTRHLAAAVLVSLSLASCASVVDVVRGDDGFSVASSLEQLPPAAEDSYQVWAVDLDAASEAAGVERPTELDEDEVARWAGALTGLPVSGSPKTGDAEYAPVYAPLPQVTHPERLRQIQEFHDLAGWSAIDVHAYAEVATPPHDFASLVADVTDEDLADLPEVEDGIRTVGEGDDLRVDLTATSPVSPTGRPVRMAPNDGRLAVASTTGPVRAWLGGFDQTLADDDGLVEMAEALDDASVVSATLSVGSNFGVTGSGGRQLTPEQQTKMSQGLPEQAFDAVGIGWAAPDGEAEITLVFRYADEDTAAAAVDPMREHLTSGADRQGRPLSDSFGVEGVDAEGRVVSATLTAATPRAPQEILSRLISRDAPFAHR